MGVKPPSLSPLFKGLSTFPGVGKGTLFTLAQLNLHTSLDVLSHLPSGGIRRQGVLSINMAQDGALVTLPATILEIKAAPKRSTRGAPLRIVCQDRSGAFFTIVLFRANPEYVARAYPPGQEKLISGRVEHFQGQAQIAHPDFVGPLEAAPYWEGYEPVYPLTKGLTSPRLRSLVRACLQEVPTLPEWLSPDLVRARGWPTWSEALRAAHAPATDRDLSPQAAPRQRLAFDEMLAGQISLKLVRAQQKKQQGTAHQSDAALRARFLGLLPFSLTAGQQQAIADIDTDMQSQGRMIRLLQGDVGSGKTVVAMMAMLTAVASGGQAALMAPTEVLARQHGRTLGAWAQALGVTLEVLTGSDRAKKKRAVYEGVASGTISLLVGTHALIQEELTFQNLTLAVIDEQHRFGVEQRLKLARKGHHPDLLAMTATPIPRTLMLTSYGDLECSYLREKPAHRQPVQTRILSLDRLEDLVISLKGPLQKEEKIYWVCPLVEESEALEIAAAEERYKDLMAALPQAKIGLVHGRLTPSEKTEAMEAFRTGALDILVATTVIEVGVDVQEATIMIIEQAERFGLAQLHQLRGRIGRGDKPGTCILLYGKESGGLARQRLQVLKDSHDGFNIAEQDWKLRGGGETLGARQSGAQTFRFVEMTEHEPLLPLAHEEAEALLAEDPRLLTDRGGRVRLLLHLFLQEEAMSYLEAA